MTRQQNETLRAAVDRIIPPDEYPGGWEAGVGDYLERLFQSEPDMQRLYEQGLDALEAEAQAADGRSFAALSADRQDALLRRVEQGDVQTEWPINARQFFFRLLDTVMEGFYADPGNGGNKDAVSWRMIGFQVTG